MIVKAVRAFFDGTSRMNREVQVRICEGLGGEVPWVYSVGWSEGAALFSFGRAPTGNREEHVDKAKPFAIPKREVWEAFKRVKANQGAAGVDGQSILEFEADLSRNLYKLWNRLSSGSYFPPPVKRVMIPKRDGGGERALGIPMPASYCTLFNPVLVR